MDNLYLYSILLNGLLLYKYIRKSTAFKKLQEQYWSLQSRTFDWSEV